MLIKEVEAQLQISAHTLRYYERMGLITPTRDKNGYRNYSQDDIQMLKKIRFLRELEIPIEDIIKMNNQNLNFQEILEQHIKSLDIKMQSLQYVKTVCQELKEKDIPLLEVMTDTKMLQEEKIDETEMRRGLKKVIEYLKPVKTIVIGSRCDVRNFVTGCITMLALALICGLGFGIGVPNTIEYFNQGLSSSMDMSPIPCYEANTTSLIISIVISYIILVLGLSLVSSKQNYIELTDNYIYICDSQLQSRLSILLGMLLKQTHERNQKYYWNELDKVKIKIVFSTISVRYGITHIYLPEFTFVFQDGYEYCIQSGLSIDEDAKTAYKILCSKNVRIEAEKIIVDYFEQDEKKGYDFFEEYYHHNAIKYNEKL